jgi:hypothetical protein
MLQQCSSANSCMRRRIIMEEHYTGCQHSNIWFEWPYAVVLILRIHFWRITFPCYMNYTISTLFLSQKTVSVSCLADVWLNFSGLFGECVCIHWSACSFVSTFTNETQASTPTIWLRNLPQSLWYHCRKVKAETILCVLFAPVSIFGTDLAQYFWYPSLTVIIS